MSAPCSPAIVVQSARLLSFAHSEAHGRNGHSLFYSKTIPISECQRQHVMHLSDTWKMRTRSQLLQFEQSGIKTVSHVDHEPHKYFDQVILTVRSGDGGHGAVLNMPRTTIKGPRKGTDKNLYHKQRKLKKQSDGTVILPMGGHGGDVIIYASEDHDNLLDYHKKKRHCAKRGGNVDAMGFLTPHVEDGISAPTLRIPVPVGTVVKRKRGAKLLADLIHPGDQVLVARGGRGGISMLEIPKENKGHLRPSISAPSVRDRDDKALVLGAPGEEVTLELTLRVVADVGLVGLPNAGKSSLLAAVTKAKPEIADYPFTTLMPNLGHLPGDSDNEDGGFSKGPKLADLPGLIKGAHIGKGLGRMFLRHLRRTRIVVHVIDASSEDPIESYRILCEELYLYNPDYLRRPHIVVFNKLDIPEAKARYKLLKEQILTPTINTGMVSSDRGDCLEDEEQILHTDPEVVAVIGISALEGSGIKDLLMAVRSELQKPVSQSFQRNAKKVPRTSLQPHRDMYIPGQWEL